MTVETSDASSQEQLIVRGEWRWNPSVWSDIDISWEKMVEGLKFGEEHRFSELDMERFRQAQTVCHLHLTLKLLSFVAENRYFGGE